MATILGLRDTESYAAYRFENWRRMNLYLFPNGGAPLTALLSLTEPEETNDKRFHWYEKPLPTQRTALTASYTNAATSIAVADVIARPGHVIMNELTEEIMEVTAVSANGLVWTVVRGKWGAPVASSGTNDPIVVIGNVASEGGRAPQSLSVDPTEYNNRTQIFRTALKLTGSAMNTALKYDRTGPYREKLREALAYHSIEQEKAYIFGKNAEWVDANSGELKRTTGGVLSFLPPGYKVKPASPIGAMTLAEWNGWLELVFRHVSNQANEKLMLCGSGVLKALNDVAINVGEMQTVAGDDSFGMELTRWYTPYGTIYIRLHPLFTQHPTWRHSALILDIHNLVYRPKVNRDTQRLTNRQANDQDARIDEFLTEAGLEVHHFGVGTTPANAQNGTHLYITNVVSFAG